MGGWYWAASGQEAFVVGEANGRWGTAEEVPGTAAKLRALIKAGGEAIEGPWDGEEAITPLSNKTLNQRSSSCRSRHWRCR